MRKNNTMMWVMALTLMLASNVRSEAPCEVEVRTILNNILDTEYCGTSRFGQKTAIRGLSPVPGQGFVSLDEDVWGPVLLEMAEAELERCKKDTIEALSDYRRAQKAFADSLPLLKTPEARGNASAPVVEARRKLANETRRLHKMLSLLGLMEGEREDAVRLIGRIAKECPIEFNFHREANSAWICQTMKDGDVEKCLELGKWYRAHKGKGSEEEIDFCRQVVAEVLHRCTSQEQYGMAARYVLEAMDGCGNYPQCNQFDAVASERLSGWLGSVQRRRMAERFLDWQPFRLSHVNKDTGAVEYEEPTPEAVAQLLRSRAAAELAADEKNLTDLREVYGVWPVGGKSATDKTYRDDPEWALFSKRIDSDTTSEVASRQRIVDMGESAHEALLAIVGECDNPCSVSSALGILREAKDNKAEIVGRLKPLFEAKLAGSTWAEENMLLDLASTLAEMGKEEDLTVLFPMLSHPSAHVRGVGIRLLGRYGGLQTLQELENAKTGNSNMLERQGMDDAAARIVKRLAEIHSSVPLAP